MITKTIRTHLAGILLLASTLACNLGKTLPATEPVPPADGAVTESAPTTVVANQPTVGSACANPYLPIVAGATWNYKLTGPVPDTFTRSIVNVEAGGFTDQDVFGTGVTRQGQWTCESGSLTALDPTNSGGSASVESENVKVDFQTTAASGVTLPALLNPGDSWTQAITLEGTESINGEQIPAKNEFTNTCTVVGIESVTVEAGTFDAMRVDCQTVMNISITMNGTVIQNPLTFNSTNWYAEKVGLVKNASTGSNLDSTTELISYSIP